MPHLMLGSVVVAITLITFGVVSVMKADAAHQAGKARSEYIDWIKGALNGWSGAVISLIIGTFSLSDGWFGVLIPIETIALLVVMIGSAFWLNRRYLRRSAR